MNAEFLNHWGTDLDVVNNAKVSFKNTSDWELRCTVCGIHIADKVQGECHRDPNEGPGCLSQFRSTLSERDRRLIAFLARGVSSGDYDKIVDFLSKTENPEDIRQVMGYLRSIPEHWTPFANGLGARFRIKAPIPIMRQVFKTKIGSVESETSRRYVSDMPDFFRPLWRQRVENVKQGSGDLLEPVAWEDACEVYNEVVSQSKAAYSRLLTLGVCEEQARFALIQGMESEAIVSNSLYGWARFCKQRRDRNHAQGEVADIADTIHEKMAELFPVSWAELAAQPTLPMD